MATELSIISYNSRGFDELKQLFCKYISSLEVVGNKVPILCNQEHFMLRGNSYKLKKAMPNFHLIINPAEKSSLCKGRPRGGLFIAVPDHFKNFVEDVSPGYWRLQAIIIKSNKQRILVINSYFPVDQKTMIWLS